MVLRTYYQYEYVYCDGIGGTLYGRLGWENRTVLFIYTNIAFTALLYMCEWELGGDTINRSIDSILPVGSYSGMGSTQHQHSGEPGNLTRTSYHSLQYQYQIC